jgi:predicted alpha/beta hydrolase family esterase
VATFLFLHGWQGSEPEHWQRWLAAELAGRGHDVRFPDFTEPDTPDLDVWLRELREELARLAPGDTTVLAHSLGCYLWLVHAADAQDPVDRVLLVAPPSPEAVAQIGPIDLPALDGDAVARAAGSTELVHADDDPYWPGGAAPFAEALAIPAHELPGKGHVNVAAGFGPWPEALAWCERLGGF